MKKNKFSCLIIGIGNIGMMYDYFKKQNYTTTHVSSIMKLKNFTLIGVVDINKKKRELFIRKYKLNAYSNINQIKKNKIDFVIISSPQKSQYNLLTQVLDKFKTKVILCEKPFTENLIEAKKINRIVKKKKANLFINYSRVSDISTDIIKKITYKHSSLNAKVFYSKSIITNCSHFLNLFQIFFGVPKKIKFINKKLFKIQYKTANVDFRKKNALPTNNFTIFNNKFKINYRMNNNKIIFESNKLKKLISSYGENINFYVLKNIENFLFKRKYKLCNIKDAIQTHKTLKLIKKTNS
tara:strand:- start:1797 stop:2684 length:888 start_codon:yes stop_codon:yes gene_type:complete